MSSALNLCLPINRFKMRQFALVLKLLELGNLHEAALALNMSQPAATKLLREVEEALGTPLFIRHPRGMKPTASGYIAGRQAELIFAELHKMQQGVAGLQNGVTGYVNIGATMAAVPEMIAPALIAMAQEHPTVEVSLHLGASDDLLREMNAGRLDFVVGSIAGAAEPHPFNYSPLSDEPLVVVAGIANPILQQPSLTLEDIHSERWILPPVGTPELRSVEDAFHAAELPLPITSMRMVSMFATAILLGNTQMLTVVPESIFRYFSNLKLAGLVNVQLRTSTESYGIISANSRALSPAAGSLCTHIRNVARQNASRDHNI